MQYTGGSCVQPWSLALLFKHCIRPTPYTHVRIITFVEWRRLRFYLCLFVCMSLRYRLPHSKSLWTDFDAIVKRFLIKVFGGWNQLEFGDDPYHLPDIGFLDRHRGILKGFFTYYCECYPQPQIKHGNLRRRFELSEWF